MALPDPAVELEAVRHIARRLASENEGLRAVAQHVTLRIGPETFRLLCAVILAPDYPGTDACKYAEEMLVEAHRRGWFGETTDETHD